MAQMEPMWIATAPEKWPDGPERMSYSTLIELEECPRRWALRSANYPQIWDGRGYPEATGAATLEGSVVHLALERLVESLTAAGIPSVGDRRAIECIKAIGGYSSLVNDCIESVLEGAERNPRTRALFEETRRELRSRVPHLRSRVQRLVSRIGLTSRGATAQGRPSRGEPRTTLCRGSYSEVELQSEALGWRGIADLISIDEGSIEIRDFKTGNPKDDHELQVRLYALLWARDNNVNPAGQLADRLVISYDSQDKELEGPSSTELVELESEVRERTDRVREAIRRHPPQARPNHDNCAYCCVKQLCAEYWTAGHHYDGPGGPGESRFVDLQLKLTARHGPSSWDATVTASPYLSRGSQVLLRVSRLAVELRVGQEIRTLGVVLGQSEQDDIEQRELLVVATMTPRSEVFVVPK